MALTDITVPYEILIRFDEAGTPKGAHLCRRRLVTLDGELLKDDIAQAEPLSIDGLAVSDIMSDATAAALRRVTELEAENAALQEAVRVLAGQVTALTAELRPAMEPDPAPEPVAEEDPGIG